ncbi:MAG: glycosyltransferase family 4 protein [Steroidobacteraceae bacterium]
MSGTSLLPTIGVLAPALASGGGVPAVADFLCAQIERTGRYRLKLMSMATSSRDDCSLRLLAPRTWRSHPRSTEGVWNGRAFTHFGAIATEFEFQRLRSTPLLTQALQQCDLIQVVSGSAAPAFAVIGCNRPVVLQVATRAAVERRKALLMGSPLVRLWRRTMTHIVSRCEERALQAVDAVMVENRWMLDYASRTVARSRTAVLNAPPGIDCEAFSPVADRGTLLADRPYILCVGRMSDPRKNVALLCKAYALLCAKLTDPPRLIFAGQGELSESARAELSHLQKQVEIVKEPSFEVLRDLFRGAACFALPSDEEGLGLVVIEAMACGVPVVSTRSGGPDAIIADGYDGFLVPLDDAEQLADRLLTLCSDAQLNLKMGERARETVVTRFSAEVAFQPFLAAYDRLLART